MQDVLVAVGLLTDVFWYEASVGESALDFVVACATFGAGIAIGYQT